MTPMVSNAPIAYRDRVAIYANAAPAGSTQPAYTTLLESSVPAEVLQVSGGEVIRGKQVEAITTHVVSMRRNPSITIDAQCRLTVLSGPYAGKQLPIHRVHYENMHGRPMRLQIHCKTKGS